MPYRLATAQYYYFLSFANSNPYLIHHFLTVLLDTPYFCEMLSIVLLSISFCNVFMSGALSLTIVITPFALSCLA